MSSLSEAYNEFEFSWKYFRRHGRHMLYMLGFFIMVVSLIMWIYSIVRLGSMYIDNKMVRKLGVKYQTVFLIFYLVFSFFLHIYGILCGAAVAAVYKMRYYTREHIFLIIKLLFGHFIWCFVFMGVDFIYAFTPKDYWLITDGYENMCYDMGSGEAILVVADIIVIIMAVLLHDFTSYREDYREDVTVNEYSYACKLGLCMLKPTTETETSTEQTESQAASGSQGQKTKGQKKKGKK